MLRGLIRRSSLKGEGKDKAPGLAKGASTHEENMAVDDDVLATHLQPPSSSAIRLSGTGKTKREEEEKVENVDPYELHAAQKIEIKSKNGQNYKAVAEPILKAIEDDKEISEADKEAFNKFFDVLVSKKLRDLTILEFWSLEKSKKAKYLREGYTILEIQFVEPFVKKENEEISNRVKFVQLIQFQVINNFRDDESEDAKKEKLMNAFSPYVAKLVTGESSQEALDLLRVLPLDELMQLCNYDCFKTCVEGIHKQLEDDKLSKMVFIIKSSNQWVCGRRHKLVKFKGGFKRIKIEGSEGGAVKIDKRDELKCAGCKKNFTRENGFESCTKSCDIYICGKCTMYCTRCKKKAQLKIGKPSWHGGTVCSHCRKGFDQAQYDRGFLRCDPCDYDCCKDCFPVEYLDESK